MLSVLPQEEVDSDRGCTIRIEFAWVGGFVDRPRSIPIGPFQNKGN